MMKQNIANALTQLEKDPEVGIAIRQLTGETDLSLYVAQIEAGTAITPHLHQEGSELYQIIEGKGVMHLGTQAHDKVIWSQHFPLTAGDCFTVKAGQVHQLENHTETPLIALFSCPQSHMTTDRTLCPQESRDA